MFYIVLLNTRRTWFHTPLAKYNNKASFAYIDTVLHVTSCHLRTFAAIRGGSYLYIAKPAFIILSLLQNQPSSS